jgi:hypothetical protein
MIPSVSLTQGCNLPNGIHLKSDMESTTTTTISSPYCISAAKMQVPNEIVTKPTKAGIETYTK